jgi:hypothetical protein
MKMLQRILNLVSRVIGGGLILGFLLTVPATAQQVRSTEPSWHLTLQAWSFHERGAVGVRDDTFGLGVMRRQNDWLAGAGGFRNSVGRWAGYGYVGYQYPFRRVRVGAIGGLTHNYNWNDRGIVPLAAAVVTVPVTPRLSVDLIGIPRIRDVSYGTVNVSFSWRFR